MKRSFCLIISFVLVSALLLSGCNLPFTIQPANNNPATEAPATELPPTQTPYIITATPLPTDAASNATEAASNTPEVAATEAPTAITHSMTPGDPAYLSDQVAADCDTGLRSQGQSQIVISGCDYWNREWLERPADSATGTYDPELDILWAQAGKKEPWVYLRLKVHDLSNQKPEFKAGFEIDDDLDSRGEFLLMAAHPTSSSWTTDGVQVWQDTNGDVGGAKPFAYDQNSSDGYETKLFDAGVGADPDLAWVRLSPKEPNTVEFAFKTSMLPNPKTFGWWAWAGLDKLTAASFELVDRDTDTDAWGLDNTCSWIWGTTPKPGQLANLCNIVQPTATPTPVPGGTAGGCPAGPHYCRIGSYWDEASCSCKFHFFILPTNTPNIIY